MDSTLNSAALTIGTDTCPTPFSLLLEVQMNAKSKIKEIYKRWKRLTSAPEIPAQNRKAASIADVPRSKPANRVWAGSCFSTWSLFLQAHPLDFFVESK